MPLIPFIAAAVEPAASVAASIVADLRYALRQLRNAPVYALTAVLTLALGLGAATAMLAIVDCVLVRPLALPHADRLVTLAQVVKGRREDYIRTHDIEAMQTQVKSFAALGAYTEMPSPVTTPDGTRVALKTSVLPGFFNVPGVAARLGRVPTSADGSAPLAVVSDAFWRDNLHGDPHAIGSHITVENRLLTIAGVMPFGFKFPGIATGTAVFIPLLLDPKGLDVNNFSALLVVARLKPGVSLAAALAEAKAVYAHGAPAKDEDRGELTLAPYRDSVIGNVQPKLLALLGACALLLLIACANSANLQIARATNRIGEMGVRAALGASRGRLLQQITTESVTVSLLGASLGLLLASAILHGLRAAYSLQFPRFDELALHPAAFAACALLATVTGVLAALAPAWNVMQIAGGLPSHSAKGSRRSRLSGSLVAVEIALTCTLLVVAGLFLRTFVALQGAPLGFDPRHVTEVSLMPLNPKEDNAALRQTHQRLLERLGTLPGVEAAAAQVSLPFSDFNISLQSTFKVTGQPAHKGDQALISLFSADYARTLGAPAVAGRSFNTSDSAGAQPVCMVNEAFARRYLKGKRTVGNTVELVNDSTDGTDDRLFKVPVAVVGIAPDQTSYLGEQPDPTLFLPYAQLPANGSLEHFLFGIAPQFAVRSALPQATLERELRAAIKETAPDMAEMSIGSLDANIAATLTQKKLALRLASGFGLLALALAAVGIYGVLSSSVAQRTREIGIRMALGSTRQGAMLLVLKQAAVMVALGLAAGLACAWPAGRAVRSFLFGVTPLDPLTLLAAACALLAVCACAAAIPAWRATQVDPIEALRTE